ncbi:NADH dehydrogenase subunit 4 [Neisseria meningitidis N1568]|nr:NADH dehydrogenase subunit 4 [Neisseria meningitidis N1568]
MIPVLFCLLGYGRQVEKVRACYYLIFYTLFFGIPYLFLYRRVFWFLSFVYYDFLYLMSLYFCLACVFWLSFLYILFIFDCPRSMWSRQLVLG